MNVFYIGVDNPISIAVPGVSSQKISAELYENDGTIAKIAPGKFVVNVKHVDLHGRTEIHVFIEETNGSKKVVDSVSFRVKRVPDPVAMVGTDRAGSVKVANFRVQKGMQAVLPNFDFEARFTVVSFEMTYESADQTMISLSGDGPVFSQEIQDVLLAARPGDKFYFDKIKVRGPDGTVRSADPLVYKLI